MSKKKNDEEKEVKTEAQNQEESKTDAEDNKAEAKEKENPLEKELKDTKDQLLRVTAEYSNFRKRSEKEKNESFAFATIKAVSEILAAELLNSFLNSRNSCRTADKQNLVNIVH